MCSKIAGLMLTRNLPSVKNNEVRHFIVFLFPIWDEQANNSAADIILLCTQNRINLGKLYSLFYLASFLFFKPPIGDIR